MSQERSQALSEVFDATRQLFHRLSDAANRAHADLHVTASQRAVLEVLFRDGPQTVPQMARAKGVSRQHIQAIVNSLLPESLVEARENPAHQRSPLLVLSSQGTECFQTIMARERELLGELAWHFRREDLEMTARTLGTASRLLEKDVTDGWLSED